MNPTTQSGESPVRHLAIQKNDQTGAKEFENVRDAALLCATQIIAKKQGMNTVELLRLWSPYR